MHLTRILLRAGARKPQNPLSVKFVVPRMEFKLRDRVSGKNDRTKEATGLEEMTLLFQGLKTHDFNDKFLQKEAAAVRKSVVTLNEQRNEARRERESTTIKIGRNLHFLQLNRYLKRYPSK